MGRIITIVSGKGGVGKTTVSGNLGIALAKLGLSVCLIDADVAMANLSLLFGMQSSPITLHDVLLGESEINDAIYDGPGGVKFIPSGLSLENYRRVDTERLRTIVQSLSDKYDYILIDAPAGIEKNVLSSIASANEILLVTQPTSPSVADVLKTKITSIRLGVKPIGTIVNFVRNEKGEISKDDIMKMLELPVVGLIPHDDEIRKSFMQKSVEPTMVRKPSAPSSKAFLKCAYKITGKSGAIEEETKESFISKLLSLFKK